MKAIVRDIISAALASIPVVYQLISLGYNDVVRIFYYSEFSYEGYFSIFWPIHLTMCIVGAFAILPIIVYEKTKQRWTTEKQRYTVHLIPFLLLSWIIYGLLGYFIAYNISQTIVFNKPLLSLPFEEFLVLPAILYSIWFWAFWLSTYVILKTLIDGLSYTIRRLIITKTY